MGIEESRKGAAVFVTIHMDPAKQLDPNAFREDYDPDGGVAESDISATGTSPPRGYKGLGHLQLGTDVSPDDSLHSTSPPHTHTHAAYARQQHFDFRSQAVGHGATAPSASMFRRDVAYPPGIQRQTLENVDDQVMLAQYMIPDEEVLSSAQQQIHQHQHQHQRTRQHQHHQQQVHQHQHQRQQLQLPHMHSSYGGSAESVSLREYGPPQYYEHGPGISSSSADAMKEPTPYMYHDNRAQTRKSRAYISGMSLTPPDEKDPRYIVPVPDLKQPAKPARKVSKKKADVSNKRKASRTGNAAKRKTATRKPSKQKVPKKTDEDDKLLEASGSFLIAHKIMSRKRKRAASKVDTAASDSLRQSRINKRRPWTKEEDALLEAAVDKHHGTNWKAIADMVPTRTHVQCLQRWRKSLHPGVIKGRWTAEEDQKLMKIVNENLHIKNWGHAARFIPGRTAKQCRERYTNHLDPDIKKGNWSVDEDKLIAEGHKRLGNKWAEIASHLPGRTENSVKIRAKCIKRKEVKKQRQMEKIRQGSTETGTSKKATKRRKKTKRS